MIDLAEVCAPIARDLERVSALLRAELSSSLPSVEEMCRHVKRFHGKMLRPTLLLLSARACGGIRPVHHTLGAVVEMIHVATLVHDDILDEAELRRGAQTVNRRWDNERAVLLGDFLISHAFHLCSSLDSQRASRAIGRATNTVCEGEIMQVAHRGDLALSEDQYFEIVSRKTAALIEVSCSLGADFAGADSAAARLLGDYGLAVGVAFQIADDLLDLLGDETETGKSVGRDAEKGKLTLPLIHHLRVTDDDGRARARELLSRSDADARRRLAAALRQTDSLDYARDAATTRIVRACAALEPLPESDARDALRAMAEFVLDRRQ